MRAKLLGSLVFLGLILFLPANLPAQVQTSTGVDFNQRLFMPQMQKVVAGIVYSPRGEPLAHATVVIANNQGAAPRTFNTEKDGLFQTDYELFDLESGKDFIATLKITRKGYEVTHRVTPMGGSINNLGMAITLRPLEPPDPALLSQDDLTNALAPRLRHVGVADGLSAKEQKDYDHAVQDYLDRKHYEDAVLRFTKVAKLDPHCLKCRTMLALAELNWGDWDDSRHELSDSVNALIKDHQLGSAEPLLVWAVLMTWQHRADAAEPYLEEARKYAPNDPFVLQELGRVECMEMNWWGADETLKKALDAGAGPEARLMRAQALFWVGAQAQAQAELNTFLNGRNPKSMPPRVRTLWENIQSGQKDQAIVAAMKAKAKKRGEEPLDYLHHPPKNLPDFQPAADQTPLADILAAVGKNVSQFFADLPNICSIEKVQQERLNRDGKVERGQAYTYRYLLTVPDQKWGPGVEEYRADRKGSLTSQPGSDDNYMLTQGFVSAPLVFHPAFQSGSTFRLLGTQKVEGRENYVIVWAQDAEKSPLAGSFQNGAIVRPTFTQGIAWVDTGNYQLRRMVKDLLTPIPQARLDKETTEINFDEVHFKEVPHGIWLPQAVTVTLDWNGRLMRNNHAYSDFLLSNVESTQKIGKPQNAEKPAEEATQPIPNTSALDHASALVPQQHKE